MKKRSIFWTIMQLFPFILIAFFFIARIGQGVAQYDSLSAFVLQLKDFTEYFKWSGISTKFESFLYNYLGFGPEGRRILANLVSFEIAIMLLRIAYEVIVFLPKFCISIFERKKGD